MRICRAVHINVHRFHSLCRQKISCIRLDITGLVIILRVSSKSRKSRNGWADRKKKIYENIGERESARRRQEKEAWENVRSALERIGEAKQQNGNIYVTQGITEQEVHFSLKYRHIFSLPE